MSDKHIIKVRMLGACVIITVPAAIREITGIEGGDYVYVQADGKRGFSVTKGAIPAKKKAVAKPAKKKLVLAKKKVAPAAKKKIVKAKPAPKPASKKIVAKPPVKKKIAPPKPNPAQVDLPLEPAQSQGEE